MDFIPLSIHDEYGYSVLLNRYHKLRGEISRPSFISYGELLTNGHNTVPTMTKELSSTVLPRSKDDDDGDSSQGTAILQKIRTALEENERAHTHKAGVVGEGTYAKIHRYLDTQRNPPEVVAVKRFRMGGQGEGLPVHGLREIMFMQEDQLFYDKTTINNNDVTNDYSLTKEVSFDPTVIMQESNRVACPSFIPKLYDTWYVKGRLHMVMEYANRTDLGQCYQELYQCLNILRKYTPLSLPNTNEPNNISSSTHVSSHTQPRWIQSIHSSLQTVWNKFFIHHLIQTICTGIEYIHSQRFIIHRDLKPGNILLSSSSSSSFAPPYDRIRSILCDWGMSTFFTATNNDILNHSTVTLSAADSILEKRHTLTTPSNEAIPSEASVDIFPDDKPSLSRWEGGMFPQVVTPHYRAVELLYGSHTYTEQIDIWSLGCILAEIVRGYIFSQRWYDPALPKEYLSSETSKTTMNQDHRQQRKNVTGWKRSFNFTDSDNEDKNSSNGNDDDANEPNQDSGRRVFRRIGRWDSDEDDEEEVDNHRIITRKSLTTTSSTSNSYPRPPTTKSLFSSDTKENNDLNNGLFLHFPDDKDDELLLQSTKVHTHSDHSSSLLPTSNSFLSSTTTKDHSAPSSSSFPSIGKPLLFRQLTSPSDGDNSAGTTNISVPNTFFLSFTVDDHQREGGRSSFSNDFSDCDTNDSSTKHVSSSSSLVPQLPVLPPLQPWQPLFYNEGGDLALLSTIIRFLGSVDTLVWPECVQLPGYMPGEIKCPYCTNEYLTAIQKDPIYGSCYSSNSIPSRRRWQEDMPWLLPETVENSCARYSANEEEEVTNGTNAAENKKNTAASTPSPPIIAYHLLGAYNLSHWLGLSTNIHGTSTYPTTASPSTFITTLFSTESPNENKWIVQIIDLLLRCFTYNPAKRISIHGILQHKLFSTISSS